MRTAAIRSALAGTSSLDRRRSRRRTALSGVDTCFATTWPALVLDRVDFPDAHGRRRDDNCGSGAQDWRGRSLLVDGAACAADVARRRAPPIGSGRPASSAIRAVGRARRPDPCEHVGTRIRLRLAGARADVSFGRDLHGAVDAYNRGMAHPDSFGARSTLSVGGRELEIFRLDALQARYDVARLPYTLRVLLENVLRREDGVTVTARDVEAVAGWNAAAEPSQEINYNPARVLLQDFTGVPAVVDLAAMRAAMADLGGDPQKINPLIPVELVIDHSVQVDDFATRFSIERNSALEFSRNRERYAFLRWGQGAFANFKAVPPNTGICHQVNLEFLARVVEERDGQAFPDTVVGTDSHTTMVNGLGVLGWGVGGIEAEAAMLGEAISMLVPQVVGFRLHGALPEGATATDLVLTVTQILRQTGVVGKFVEYFGHGLAGLPLADRATIGNMSPGVRRHVRLLPGRRRDAPLPPPHRPQRGPGRARRGVLPGERALARPGRAADVLAGRRARPLHRRAVDRRAAPPAGPDPAARCAQRLLGGAAVVRGRPRATAPSTRRTRSRWTRATPPALTATARAHGGRADDRRRDGRDRPRRRRDRRDHVLHEHVQPGRDDRRRPAREEGGRARAHAQAVGEDEPRARLEGRDRVLREGRPDAVPRGARLQHGRLRLHDVHRELGPAARGGLAGRRRAATSSPAPSSPATATSRRASIPR